MPRAGYGSLGEAMGGVRYVTGDPDRPPARTGISFGDSLAATFACMGTLVAIHQRQRSGKGQIVDPSDLRGGAGPHGVAAARVEVAGYQRERTGSVLPNVAPSNAYSTADGEMVLVGANQDTVFARLAAVMGNPALADDRYTTHSARGANADALDDLIAE